MNIADNITSTMEKMDIKVRYMLFVGILIVVFLLDFFVLMRPQLSALGKIKPEIEILSKNLNKLKDDVTRLQQYQNQVSTLNKKVDDVHLKIKSKEDIPLILEKISHIANKNKVKINQIMPNSANQAVLLENPAIDNGQTLSLLSQHNTF